MTVSFIKKFISNKIKPSYTITLHGFCLVLNCKMVLRTKEDLSIHHYNEKKKPLKVSITLTAALSMILASMDTQPRAAKASLMEAPPPRTLLK